MSISLVGVMDTSVSLVGVMDTSVSLVGIIDGFVVVEYGDYSLDFSQAMNSFYLGVI